MAREGEYFSMSIMGSIGFNILPFSSPGGGRLFLRGFSYFPDIYKEMSVDIL